MSDKTPAARLRGNRRQAPPRVLLPGLPQHEQALHYWTAPLSAVQQESEDAVAMLADFVEILLGQLDADLFANISPACRHHLRAALSGDRSAVTSLFLDSVGARLPPLASTSTAVEVAKKVSDDDDAVPSRDGPARGSTATGYQQTMSAAAQRMCRIPEADPFFGGRRELVSRIAEAVRQTMADRRCAIAFLSGQPGVGTSEVALAVARNLSKAFDGGTYYLDLYGLTPDALRNPRTIVRILAEALSLDLGGDAMDETEALDRLFTRLADRKVLLVLDNARDADHIAPLARRVASCGLIITSRDRLQDFADPGLSFTVDILERTESVGLLERFLGDREHNGIDLEGIAALCADVPLALRMVGARIATEPHVDLGYLRRALENETTRLDYLKAGARAVRAAIGLSYALLESQARRTLRLITAFPGTTVTARSLGHCADNDVFRQEFVLHQLTDRNLATYAVASNVLDIPEARFTLFELIRIFAGERLTEEEPQADLEEFRSRAIRTCSTV